MTLYPTKTSIAIPVYPKHVTEAISEYFDDDPIHPLTLTAGLEPATTLTIGATTRPRKPC